MLQMALCSGKSAIKMAIKHYRLHALVVTDLIIPVPSEKLSHTNPPQTT